MGKMVAAALVSGMLLLACCASGPDVRAVSDPSANFAQFRTFGFAEPLGTDRAGYQSIVSQQLKAATTREMTARGLTYAPANPDLLVNFSAQLNDKMRVTTTPEPVMAPGYYGYRRGFYQPWPMYTERTDVSQYTEGTLTIDVIDAARKQLVWEGTVTKSITSKDQANVPAALDAAVAAAFAKYPSPGPAK
jgi:Domain of unknown function (DUF4136)